MRNDVFLHFQYYRKSLGIRERGGSRYDYGKLKHFVTCFCELRTK